MSRAFPAEMFVGIGVGSEARRAGDDSREVRFHLKQARFWRGMRLKKWQLVLHQADHYHEYLAARPPAACHLYDNEACL